MLMTVLFYVFAAVHILLPPHLAVRLWRLHTRTLGAWLIEAGFTTAALTALYLFGRWDIVGYGLQYWLVLPCLIGALASGVRVVGRPLTGEDGGVRWRWEPVLEGLLFVGVLGWGLMGYAPERSTVDVAPPLRGEAYYVAHGGGTPPINYHGAASTSQRYALDITQLGEWGVRADGLTPERLPAYDIYGDTLHSPVTGTVVQAVDSLRDARWPEGQPAAGNHVWLRRDGVYVLLAHLRRGSVRVETGERVTAGEPIARVGNTGNTTEPHLHMHAIRHEAPLPALDSLSGAPPVPMTVDGRFLLRNDRLRTPTKT